MNLAANEDARIECHYVTTEDGYNLRLYRLPAEERNESDGNHLRTMFFMHGLLGSSPMYITYREHSAGNLNCFAFLLSSCVETI